MVLNCFVLFYLLPIPSPGYLPDLEIGLGSPALQVDFFYQLSYQGRPNFCHFFRNFFFFILWPGRGENSGLGPAVAPEVKVSRLYCTKVFFAL